MSLFRYKALSADGEVLEGEMEAADEASVVARLQQRGHLPVRAEPAAGKSRQSRRGFSFTRSAVRLDIVTRELSRLMSAGIPLEGAMQILVEIAENKDTARLLSQILNAIRSGSSFADALGEAGPPFDRLFVGMVRAGEAGGTLPEVLQQLSDYMARMRELRASVTAALIYPCILLAVSVTSLIVLLTYVVPQFEDLFSGSEVALPASTQMVFALAHWLSDDWWIVLLAVLVALLILQRLRAWPRTRLRIDRMLLALPVLGTLLAQIEVARLCRTLGTLIGNGVPVLNALTIVEEVLANMAIRNVVREASNSLKSGSGLAAPLAAGHCIPSLAVHMIRVGEETGRLDTMLNDVATLYDEEIRQRLRRLLALLEPILILGLGALVGAIIVSILAAILSLNQLAF